MRPLVGALVSAGVIGAATEARAAAPRPVSASSESTGTDGVKHLAAHAFDGLLSTGWAEGDLGDGVGAWLEVRFDAPTDVSSVSIYPGWLGGSDREIREYGRPKVVTLSFEVAGGEPVTRQERLLDPGDQGPLRHDVSVDVPKVKAIRIALDEVLTGGLYSDTFIAEVAVNLVGGAPPPAVADVATWLGSDAGQKAAEAQRTTAIGVFEKVTSAEFGDRDGLKALMDWAADGAPYLRDRAAKVPAGFRVQAIQPDQTSIEALLKL
ncbi:MAG: discoidin domain-containing protein, partial [Myxococcota bacterium]